MRIPEALLTAVLAVIIIAPLTAQTSTRALRTNRGSKERVIQLGDFISFLRFDGGCTVGMERVPIRSDGAIVLPLIGIVQAEGLKPSQLSTDIETRLEKYLKRP